MYNEEHPVDVESESPVLHPPFIVGGLHNIDWFSCHFESSNTCDKVGEVCRGAKEAQDTAYSFGLFVQYDWQYTEHDGYDNHDRTTELGFLEEGGAKQSKASEGEAREDGKTERHALGRVWEDEDGKHNAYS